MAINLHIPDAVARSLRIPEGEAKNACAANSQLASF